MSNGAVERSAETRPAKDLAGGAGETVPLKPKENFEGRPHLEPGTASFDDGTIREHLLPLRPSRAGGLANMRKRTVPSCRYCDQHMDDPMMPAHDASPRCESGKRPHCTCDTCF